MATHRDEPALTFTTVEDLEAYMSSRAEGLKGFWLKLSRSGAPKISISKQAAIEAALCCGWIDGQLAKFDDGYFLVRMTPRRPKSRWSEKNRATAERLARQGRMKPAGQAQIDAAKKDGRWAAAYASQGKAGVPQDLETALAANKAAKGFFDKLDRANRYSVIYRVGNAVRPETRAKRIAQYVGMLARGEAIHAIKPAGETTSGRRRGK